LYSDLFVLVPAAAGEEDNLSPVGSPIVLQRRGSVYGANVPMITGVQSLQLIAYALSGGKKLLDGGVSTSIVRELI
jgi:hypothetical protein